VSERVVMNHTQKNNKTRRQSTRIKLLAAGLLSGFLPAAAIAVPIYGEFTGTVWQCRLCGDARRCDGGAGTGHAVAHVVRHAGAVVVHAIPTMTFSE
jgi:hypothetical protein